MAHLGDIYRIFQSCDLTKLFPYLECLGYIYLYLFFSGNNAIKKVIDSFRPQLSIGDYCHTRPYLEISAQLKIWQVSACKIGPQSGIIIKLIHPPHPPTWSTRLKVIYISNHWLDLFQI